MEKPEEKRPIGNPGRGWEGNINEFWRDRMKWYGLDSCGSG
jgi:hypothetical protein